MRSHLMPRKWQARLSIWTRTWRPPASSIWPGQAGARNEARRGPLGGSGPAIALRANGAPPGDCDLSRWIQPDRRLAIDYRCSDFDGKISWQRRSDGDRDFRRRGRSGKNQLRDLPPGDHVGSRETNQE